jgi:translation initiation factor 2B subunit (eIF-2B alpha/beta/delta family)
MEPTEVAMPFIRNEGDLLFRSSEARADSDRWGTVIGRVESDAETTAGRTIHERTGIAPEETTLVRVGNPFTTETMAFAERLVVHPFLFDVRTQDIETNRKTGNFEWVPPTALLGRETVPESWEAYDRVRPTVASIEADTDHGSTWLSVRALEVLRDEATLLDSNRASEFDSTRDIADALVDVRPAMTAVVNRVHKALGDAEDESPRAVETAAHDSIERALTADSAAAEKLGSEIDGNRVATLSRSGTVLQALEAGHPDAVLVAESRPGREGTDVAERVAPSTSVTLTTDTGFAHQLRTQDVDLFVVGADSVLADGRVVNKVGTRSAAIAAAHEDIPVLVATASAKIRPADLESGDETALDPEPRDDATTDIESRDDATIDLEPRDETELYDGDVDMSVINHTFDVTPVDCLDAVVTERGRLDTAEIEEIAAEHARLAQ